MHVICFNVKPSECLRQARELIRDPKKMCRGQLFKAPDQRDLIGAIIHIDQPVAYEACNFVRRALGLNLELSCWLDDDLRVHIEIMELITRAIELAELKGS